MRQSRDSSRPAASSSGRLGEVQVFQHKTGELELIAPLSQHHIVVGRNADAAICLDHETVSRNHAELICGPFGQWWVHDLESTNGTYVNGSRVRDRLLNPGDAIRIGRFVLYLKLPEQRPRVDTHHPEERSEHIPPSRPSTWTRPPSGSRPELTTVMALPVGAPREISAAHLARTITLRKQLMGIEDARGRLELVCDFIVADEFPSHSAAIVRLHGPEDPRLVVPPRSRTGSPALSELSRTVLHALWNTRDSVVATNLDEGEQASITPAQSKRRRKLTLPRQERALAVVACPLAEDEERIDSLYVELPGPYGTDEWRTLLALIADAYSQVELVWEMRDHVRSSAFVERELEMARQIQDGLIPTQTQFPHLEVAIGYEPSRWVGGDYVDAVVLADRRILLAIADVCGKGLQAALISSSLHTLVRASSDPLVDLPDLAQRMNRYLCNYSPPDSFATMVFVLIDPRSGELECLNAGHPPPLVVDGEGGVRRLQSETNVALGMLEASFVSQQGRLEADETLLLYTDGLFEVNDQDGRPLGMTRFADVVARAVVHQRRRPIAELQRALARELRALRGAQLFADDNTFLFARRA